ncbi:hypothetical protein QM012_005597 [Aureobasidium pullulans]|uniref:Terpene synthase n=1 Tax=Aureobasidium pullulans TaxID=5580 RepID=A0ABR0T4Q8_AURPU
MSVIVQRAPDDPRPLDDPRIDLSKRLKSHSFYIPNLRTAYKDWPEDVSPHYPELKEALNKRIEDLYPPQRAAALIKGDYGLLSSMWWPRASAERLKTCTFWFLWLFTWDDEIDQSTSELFINIDNANAFREESYHFVRHVLGVGNEATAKWGFDQNPPHRPLICSLDVIGAELSKVYDKDQIMCFVDEIYYYMDCQQREQRRKLTGVIPTPEQYWETRLGTSAVTSMLALNEFADSQSLPRWVMTHPRMTDIWREVNLNMSLSNDMLSLRKEIKHGDIDSIVPVLIFNTNLTVQEAIADTCTQLQKNIGRFDQWSDELCTAVQVKQPSILEDVKSFITGCKYNQMANLMWSLKTSRYGLGDIPRDEHGGMTIVVD